MVQALVVSMVVVAVVSCLVMGYFSNKQKQAQEKLIKSRVNEAVDQYFKLSASDTDQKHQ